jgi:hypothetical protein
MQQRPSSSDRRSSPTAGRVSSPSSSSRSRSPKDVVEKCREWSTGRFQLQVEHLNKLITQHAKDYQPLGSFYVKKLSDSVIQARCLALTPEPIHGGGFSSSAHHDRKRQKAQNHGRK